MSGNILNNTVTKYVSHLKFSNSLIYNYHNYTSNQITTNIFLPKQKKHSFSSLSNTQYFVQKKLLHTHNNNNDTRN